MNSHIDLYYMNLALLEAQKAQLKGEVPVGCVIVRDGQVITRSHNLKETRTNSLLHAEIIAIYRASKKLKTWRLTDVSLYVTLEPCVMCAGAMIQARIKRVVFGAKDPKAGAAGSVFEILTSPKLNHQCPLESGVLETPCGEILKEFFKSKRTKRSQVASFQNPK